MIRVGLIGNGMMGNVHLDVYAQLPDVQVVALSDRIPERRSGLAHTTLNVQSAKSGFNGYAQARQYAEGSELIADPDIDLIDICVPTPQHVELALAALQAGKHVLVEKPLARKPADAQRLIDAARTSPGYIMCAMCMRFWPGWSWLKETIDKGTYGRVLAAQFRRVASFPGGWYQDAKDSGGAALDLHVHDTDFIHYCFGMPKAVRSVGYARDTAGIDHISTQYLFENIPLVTAEGGWSMAKGFNFHMQYCVNFEQATAVFDLSQPHPLRLFPRQGTPTDVELPPGMGYNHEIRYLLDCIASKTRPTTVTLEHATASLRIAQAERESVTSGKTVTLNND